MVEELSTVDGAVGWIAGVGGSVNVVFSGWVSDDVGRALCADPILVGRGMRGTGSHDFAVRDLFAPADYVQERIAKAEAIVRSGRAFLYEVAARLCEAVCSEGRLTEKQHAVGRLALMHAVASGAQAVDLVYHAAGTASIFTKNLLERFFRDVHVATQHRFASPEEMYQVGRALLGAPPP